MKPFALAAALLVAGPALAESPSGTGGLRPRVELEGSTRAAVPRVRSLRSVLGNEARAARQIRTTLDGSERAALGADSGVRRFIRLTLEDSGSVASFPPLDAFAAREELDAGSSGPVRSSQPVAARPLRTSLQESPASRPSTAGRSIRSDLDGDRIALSTPLPARRIRTTLD